jgi:DNA invertase Pin-like site-specific DNA recombinase
MIEIWAGHKMTPAIIYIRFSSKKQEHGASRERQIDDCKAFCKRQGWEVVDILQDLGKSAWKGDHLKSGRLGEFADDVRNGVIPYGTVLVVEKLDRISRLEVRQTQRWMEDLCEAGISIATVEGSQVYDDKSLRSNLMQTFEILMRGKLAHDESTQKSERISDARRRAFQQAKATGRVITASCPSWLKPKPDRSGFDVIESRAEIIRDIYQMSADGMGSPWIARDLNQRGIKAWGKWRKHHSTETWEIAAVLNILRHPSVEGDYVSGFGRTGVKLEGHIVGYYPRVVDADLVARARAALKTRVFIRGPKGAGIANLFAGVVRCAICGGPMHLRKAHARNPKRQTYRSLHCFSAARFPDQLIDDIQRVTDVAPEPVEADDDHGVTGAGELDQLGQLLPVVPATAGGLLEDAFTSRLFKGVDLGLVVLSGGAATAVSNFHKCPKSYLSFVNCDDRI